MENTQEKEKRMLSVEDVADYLGISRQTIYNKVAPKSKETFPIPAKRVGRLIRFDRRDVENYIARI